MAKVLNKCPICGGKLEFCSLYQYSYDYTIKKNGELSKKAKKSDACSMDCGFIYCQNEDFVTDFDLVCTTNKNIKIWEEHGKFMYEDLDKD